MEGWLGVMVKAVDSRDGVMAECVDRGMVDSVGVESVEKAEVVAQVDLGEGGQESVGWGGGGHCGHSSQWRTGDGGATHCAGGGLGSRALVLGNDHFLLRDSRSCRSGRGLDRSRGGDGCDLWSRGWMEGNGHWSLLAVVSHLSLEAVLWVGGVGHGPDPAVGVGHAVMWWLVNTLHNVGF